MSHPVDALLEFAAILNNGPDHNNSFELLELPAATSLQEALDRHFASFVNWRTKATHPASEWHIRIGPPDGDAATTLAPIIDKWMFGMPYSPSLGEGRDWVRRSAVEALCSALVEVVGDAEVSAVHTSPPMWYEAHWQDFALSSSRGRWLLHLGVTD